MQKFDEAFYTDDFDQKMLEFIQDNFKLERKNTYISSFLEGNTILRYGVTDGNFWTTDSWYLELFGTYLTKQQFKEKIGMTDKKPDKQEKKIKHWVVETLPENIKHPRTFIAATLKDTKSGFNGVEDNGAYYDCLKRRWKYTPVYEEDCVSEEKIELCEEQTNTFTKSMLVSGKHVVELSDGKNMLLLGDRLVDKDGWYNLSLFNENLSHNDEYDINIVSVYKMTEYFTLEDLSDTGELVLIWQRETPEQAQKRIRKRELEEKVETLRQELKQAENELQEI